MTTIISKCDNDNATLPVITMYPGPQRIQLQSVTGLLKLSQTNGYPF